MSKKARITFNISAIALLIAILYKLSNRSDIKTIPISF